MRHFLIVIFSLCILSCGNQVKSDPYLDDNEYNESVNEASYSAIIRSSTFNPSPPLYEFQLYHFSSNLSLYFSRVYEFRVPQELILNDRYHSEIRVPLNGALTAETWTEYPIIFPSYFFGTVSDFKIHILFADGTISNTSLASLNFHSIPGVSSTIRISNGYFEPNPSEIAAGDTTVSTDVHFFLNKIQVGEQISHLVIKSASGYSRIYQFDATTLPGQWVSMQVSFPAIAGTTKYSIYLVSTSGDASNTLSISHKVIIK